MSRGQGRVYRPTYGQGDERREGAHWMLDYCLRGKRFRESSHTTSKTEALRLLRERLGQREEGRVIGRPDKVTLADLRAGLERHYQRAGNRSLRRAQQALDHLVEFLGSATRALELTKQRVGSYFEHRVGEGAARATVRYELAILRAAFSVAVDEDLLAVRPAFKLPTVRNVRTEFFEDGEFAALLLELPDYLRPVVRFARMTGWRKGEILGLTWDQVDWEGRIIRLAATQTKGGDARAFPFGLAPELGQLLEQRWAGRQGTFVFHREGRPIRFPRRAWTSACRRAGLTGRRIHDLRRTAARDYRRAGVSEGEIMQLCGWKTRSMFDRYNIIDEADRARAVARRFGAEDSEVATKALGKATPGTPTELGSPLSSSPA